VKKAIIGLILIVCLLVPVSCAAPAEAPAPRPTPAPAPMPVPPPAPPSAPARGEDSSATIPGLGQPWAERMIVRTGEMRLVVKDVPIALDQIVRLAEDFGGYVVSSKVWGNMIPPPPPAPGRAPEYPEAEGEVTGTITIRVPAEHFNDVMGALHEVAIEVTSEETSSKDVTEEYVDLSAKLQNLEATEEQLLQIMEKAETVEDILNVQRELSKTRGEIEQTKGRMQYLERTSETSLIEIHLEQAELGVNFTANKKKVKEREKVEFEGRIAGGFAPYSYEWDFGDGETSTSNYPTHAYKAAGSYTVSLKVTDDRGNTDTKTRSEYITVLPGWSAGSIASSAWNGMVIFGQVLADIFIWIGIFSPVWIVGGGVFYWWRRRKKKV